jgi:hypothetical protein
MAWSPAVLAGRERGSGLQGIIAAELRGKAPACGSLHSGSSFSRRRWCQPLQARLIGLLHALLALEHTVLSLQQPFLCALRPQAFRLLRLQLLHALLQAIDAVLPRCALARQHVALPLLHDLLPLLDALLTLLRPRFDLLLSRRSRASRRRCARWYGDTRLRMSRHGRSLRRGAMNLGSWRCNMRRGRPRWRCDTWRHMRGHRWTL